MPKPSYTTKRGEAYLGDCRELLASGKWDNKVDLIMTSPPYALLTPKAYGNVSADKYVEWFMTFVPHFYRVLKPKGSMVIDIGGTWNRGVPTRSLYHWELLLALCKDSTYPFHLAQEGGATNLL